MGAITAFHAPIVRPSKPLAAFVTRHPITDAQRADFAAYACVQVRGRFRSVEELWLDVLFDCGGAPDVIVLTYLRKARHFAVRYIHARAPETVIVRAVTDQLSDGAPPNTLYLALRHEPGNGLIVAEWTPKGA